MSVTNGQRASAQTFNDAFLSRTTDSDTVAIIGLNHPSSGGLIANAQQFINSLQTQVTDNDNDIAQLFLEKEDKNQKGVANGYAELDGSGKVPLSQIPDKFASIEGNWDASTNTPTLTDGVGNLGEIYVVNVAGTQDLGSGSQTFDVGDWIVYNSSNEWKKVINSTAVTSVNGQTGAVSLALDNLTDVNVGTPGAADDQKAIIWDNASGEYILGQPVGSGGAGGISYVINPDAELTADNHLIYDDGAVAEPVNGAGVGSPSLTVTRTTTASEILRGDASFLVDKPGATDCQGEGVHIELDPIDPRDLGQRLQVSLDYKMIAPLNTLDGDFRFFVYDVDNATLIGAIENDDNGDLLNHEGDGASFVGFFNATDSLNYRLLAHCTTTDVAQRRFVYDNVKLGPIENTLFFNATDWKEYSIVIGADPGPAPTLGGVDENRANWRRVGDTLEVNFNYRQSSGGTAGTGTYTYSLPPGLEIDYDKLSTSSQAGFGVMGVVGTAAISSTSRGIQSGFVQAYTSDTLIIYTGDAVDNPELHSATRSPYSDASLRVTFTARIPIVGWKATNVVSNTELTQSTLMVSAVGNGGEAVTANIEGIYFAEQSDLFNAWNLNVFTAPKSLTYRMSGFIRTTAGTASALQCRAYIDGSYDKLCGFNGGDVAQSHSFFWEGYLQKGQTWELRSNIGLTLENTASLHHLEIRSAPDFTSYGVVNDREYFESEVQDIPGTIFWNSATPGGTVVKKYKWIKYGKKVDFFFWYDYSGAPASNNFSFFDIPPDLPQFSVQTLNSPQTSMAGSAHVGNGGSIGNPAAAQFLLSTNRVYVNVGSPFSSNEVHGHITYYTD